MFWPHFFFLPSPPRSSPTPYPPNFMFFLFNLINLLINKNKTKIPNCNNRKAHKTYTDQERNNTKHLSVWSVAPEHEACPAVWWTRMVSCHWWILIVTVPVINSKYQFLVRDGFCTHFSFAVRTFSKSWVCVDLVKMCFETIDFITSVRLWITFVKRHLLSSQTLAQSLMEFIIKSLMDLWNVTFSFLAMFIYLFWDRGTFCSPS